MGRLSTEKIKEEVESKGFTLVSDEGYENINSLITVKCEHGHLTQVSLADFRAASFTCPQCDKVTFVNPTSVPPKQGYRVIAFDQATESFGLSIFEDGQLKFFNLYTFNGLLKDRLVRIKKFVEDIVIKEWKPDFIVMEDIQYQWGAVLTFKVLAELLGVLETICTEHGIPYEVVSPNVWRKYAGTCGKNRTQEKQLSVITVQEKYGVKVNNDVAEAILIGRYGVHSHHQIKNAFGN